MRIFCKILFLSLLIIATSCEKKNTSQENLSQNIDKKSVTKQQEVADENSKKEVFEEKSPATEDSGDNTRAASVKKELVENPFTAEVSKVEKSVNKVNETKNTAANKSEMIDEKITQTDPPVLAKEENDNLLFADSEPSVPTDSLLAEIFGSVPSAKLRGGKKIELNDSAYFYLLFPNIIQKKQKFQINSREATEITLASGAKLFFEASTFVHSSHKKNHAFTAVHLEVAEYTKPEEIILQGLATTTKDSSILETNGMFHIAAKDSAGNPLVAGEYAVFMPKNSFQNLNPDLASEEENSMGLFYGNPELMPADSTEAVPMNWQDQLSARRVLFRTLFKSFSLKDVKISVPLDNYEVSFSSDAGKFPQNLKAKDYFRMNEFSPDINNGEIELLIFMKKNGAKKLIIRSRGKTTYEGTLFLQNNGLLSKRPRKFGSLSFRKRKHHKVWLDYLCKSFDADFYQNKYSIATDAIKNDFNRHSILREKLKEAEKYVTENFENLWEQQYKKTFNKFAKRPVIIKVEIDLTEKIQAYQSIQQRNMEKLMATMYQMTAVFPRSMSWINIDRFLKEETAPFQIDKEGSNQELAATVIFHNINSVMNCTQTDKRITCKIPKNRAAVVMLTKFDEKKNILAASKTVRANDKLKLSDFVFAPLKKKDLQPSMAQNQTNEKKSGEPEPKP